MFLKSVASIHDLGLNAKNLWLVYMMWASTQKNLWPVYMIWASTQKKSVASIHDKGSTQKKNQQPSLGYTLRSNSYHPAQLQILTRILKLGIQQIKVQYFPDTYSKQERR